MRIKYTFDITADLGKVLPSVGELTNSINSTMNGFGFPEKLSIRSKIMSGSIEVDKPMTKEEIGIAISIIKKNLGESELLQKYVCEVENFCIDNSQLLQPVYSSQNEA